MAHIVWKLQYPQHSKEDFVDCVETTTYNDASGNFTKPAGDLEGKADEFAFGTSWVTGYTTSCGLHHQDALKQ